MSKFVAILGLFAIIGIVDSHNGNTESAYIIPFEGVLKELSEILDVPTFEYYHKCLKERQEWYNYNYVDMCIGEAERSLIHDGNQYLLRKTRAEKIRAINAFLEYLNRTEPICVERHVPLGKAARQWLVTLKEQKDQVYVEGDEPLFHFRDGVKQN